MQIADIIAEVDAECRLRDVRMLGREKAARLAELIRDVKPGLVVEVGTAIGYSGLWIANALRELSRGRLITFELEPDRAAEAGQSFKRAGLDHLITQHVGDARQEIKGVLGPVDFLFLDGGFGNYYPCLMNVREQLSPKAVLVADNACIGADEMADYLEYVRRHYQSRTEWFETDLSWNPKDAMEISTVGPGKHP
jgi:predicted O-methyltransferase YrrM